MKPRRWTWAAARSIGTSHIKAGKDYEDFGACLEIAGSSDTVLIAVASDGAGSACHSKIGSWITTRVFVQSAVSYVKDGRDLRSFSSETAQEWVDDIRDRIGAAASRIGAKPRDFAATLVGCLIGTECSVFVHVGDGAFVFRTEGESNWNLPTWPAQGEFAATTFFVTDEPEAHLQFVSTYVPIEEVAVFSDGIERLALQFSTKSAFSPFFDKMFTPLRGKHTVGRDRKLSRDLRNFLDGPSVCEKTDDDKTLVLATRHLELI
jgi:protein phosphatase 2C-like protein